MLFLIVCLSKFYNFAMIMMCKKVIWFVVNPISGTADKAKIISLIPEFMDAERFECKVLYTSHRGHAAEYAQSAVREKVDVVVAVGGDGTVNEVAGNLVHSQTALGIIPCGSGNGLARHLSIPMNPEGALKVLSDFCIKSLDYGLINNTPFFCTCGVGFDAFVSSVFAKAGKRGMRTYIESTLKESLSYKPDVYEIEVNGQTKRYRALLIACANASQYGNNFYIAPHASMSDGQMDVTIMEPFNMLEAPQITMQMFNRTITKNPHIKTFQCRSLKIRRRKEGVIHFDGDPKDEGKEVFVELVPRAIRMVVNDREVPEVSPLVRTFMDIYNRMNAEIETLRRDIKGGQKRITSINRELLERLRSKRN